MWESGDQRALNEGHAAEDEEKMRAARDVHAHVRFDQVPAGSDPVTGGVTCTVVGGVHTGKGRSDGNSGRPGRPAVRKLEQNC